jgi:hypothetical protein
MSAYDRMLNQKLSVSFWGESNFQQRFKSPLEDQDKTREQADDTETTKQGQNDGTDNE